jgi:hypothetical protein
MENTSVVFGAFVGIILAAGLGLFALLAIIMAFVKKTRGWVILAVSLVVLLGGALGIGGLVGYSTVSKELSKPRTLVSKDGKTSLDLPAGWIDPPMQLSPMATIQAAAILQNSFVMVITESKQGKEIPLDAYTKVVLEQMQHNVQNAKVGPTSNLTVNGLPAMQARLAGHISGMDIVYLVTAYDGGDSLHQVVAWTTPANESKMWTALQTISRGFKLVAKSGAVKS